MRGLAAAALSAAAGFAPCADQTPLVTFGGRPPPPAAPVALPDWSPPPSGVSVDATLPQTPFPAATVTIERPGNTSAGPIEFTYDRRSLALTAEELLVPAEPVFSVSLTSAPTLRFLVRGNRSLSLETIDGALAPFVNGVASDAQLEAAARALRAAYQQGGHVFTRVHALPVTTVNAPVVIEVLETQVPSLRLAAKPGASVKTMRRGARSSVAMNSAALRMTKRLRLIRD